MNPALGTMPCPLSVAAGKPHEATVHQQNSKRAPLYWRCECGTMQPLTESGQAMMALVTTTTTVAASTAKDGPKPKPDDSEKPDGPDPESPAPEKKTGGAMDFLFGGDDDE